MLKGKTALAYTAGIIDGEGCISIYLHRTITAKRQRNPFYQLHVSVSSTDEWLCQWLKMQYGGSVRLETRYLRESQRSPCWKWALMSSQAGAFLEQILPYLQLKRPQAEIAIAFQKSKRKYRVNRCFAQLHTPEEIAVEEAQAILLASLHKKKGVKNG
jgi:hypothetical protein